MCAIISDTRASLQFATACSAGTATTILAAGFFRAAMGRIFYGDWDGILFTQPALFAIIVAVVWFSFVFTCSAFAASRAPSVCAESDPSKSEVPTGAGRPAAILPAVISTALVLAISAWLVLNVNDDLLASRLEPWILPLIWLQEPGFHFASRLFQCQSEGFSTGCEGYKTVPTFLLSNAAAYFPFVLITWSIYRRSERMRSVWPSILRSLIRWGTVLGSVGLCMWLFFFRFTPYVHLPTHKWDIGLVAWTALEIATGTLALGLFLSVPFCGFTMLRAGWTRRDIRPALVDLTWVTSFAFVALIVGNLGN
jgi:hypothetical protein